MARPGQEGIETFMSITGASESVALQKLEEHSGDLNAAVNAHFTEGDRTTAHETTTVAPPNDFMDVDEQIQVGSIEPPFPLLSDARSLNPFPLRDPRFGGSLFDRTSDFTNRAPFVSHPRERREIPIEVKDGNESSNRSGLAPTIEDVTGSTQEHGPEVHGTIIMDDEDDENSPPSPIAQATGRTQQREGILTDSIRDGFPSPSVPETDIEEEMIRAAIEASKREVQEGYSTQQFDVHNLTGDPGSQERRPHLEDAELAHAVSLSLKTAEQEKALRKEIEVGASVPGANSSVELKELQKLEGTNGSLEPGSSSFQDENEDTVEEQPLVRNRTRNLPSNSTESAKEVADVVVSPQSSPGQGEQNTINQSQMHPNGNAFPSDEWGGISSQEHDEAVMLEAAMFGGIPDTSGYMGYGPRQLMRSGLDGPAGSYPRPIYRPPSPNLTAQRLLREQQDDEYLASLQADREKEQRAMEEAEFAREAELEEQKLREEETRKKLEEEQELERQLAAKEASLPQEPMPEDENAVTLLVRMPDGSRRGRRFLKSDKLQLLFDFIDVGRGIKPSTYRLVRPYPRHAFSDQESALSLNELGLTSKQEALYLELV